MSQLWNTAERLRAVNAARKRFITLWAIDQAHRLFDVQWRQTSGDPPPARVPVLPAIRPPAPATNAVNAARWSWLYRGSVLDD